MTLPEIKEDILRKLGIEVPGDAPANIVQDVLQAVNTAGQVLNAGGDPFWQVNEATVSVTGATASQVIAGHSVKSVRGADGRPLLRCESPYQLDSFVKTYYGSSAAASFPALAYFVETRAASGGGMDVTVRFGPTPLNAETLTITHVAAFTPWVTADLSDPSKSADVPLDYVESMFLPLARYYASRSHWFYDEKLAAKLEMDFRQVVQVLGAVNPNLRVPTPDQRKEAIA